MEQAVNNWGRQRFQFLFFVVLATAVILINYQRAHRFDDVKQVSVDVAKSMIDAGALIIDVRDADKFHFRHIPGAINIPLIILQSGIPASIAKAITQPVVVYCGDGVTIGPEGTQLLNRAGFAQAVNIREGMSGWADAGLPVQN